jgi:hypothetical protein
VIDSVIESLFFRLGWAVIGCAFGGLNIAISLYCLKRELLASGSLNHLFCYFFKLVGEAAADRLTELIGTIFLYYMQRSSLKTLFDYSMSGSYC